MTDDRAQPRAEADTGECEALPRVRHRTRTRRPHRLVRVLPPAPQGKPASIARQSIPDVLAWARDYPVSWSAKRLTFGHGKIHVANETAVYRFWMDQGRTTARWIYYLSWSFGHARDLAEAVGRTSPILERLTIGADQWEPCGWSPIDAVRMALPISGGADANFYLRSTDGNDADGATTWALSKATLGAGALAIAGLANDIIWTSQVHAETAASAKTLTFPTADGLRVLSCSDAAEPPTTLNTTPTSSVTTTGNFAITIPSGFGLVLGFTLSSSTGNSGTGDFLIHTSGAVACGMTFDGCALVMGSTNAGSPFQIGVQGGNNQESRISFFNTSFKFGNVGQFIGLRHGRQEFVGVTLDGAGSAPTALFTPATGTHSEATVEASNLAGAAWTAAVDVGAGSGTLVLRSCEMPSGFALASGTFASASGLTVYMINCDSSDTNYRYEERSFRGTIVSEIVIVMTGGQSDGTTPQSLKMTSSASVSRWVPLLSPPIPLWNEATGSSKVFPIEIVHDSVTAMKDTDIAAEAFVLETSGKSRATLKSDRAASNFYIAAGTAQASSSVTWTTTGLTNPNKQKLEPAGTPAEKGHVIGRVALYQPSKTVYINAPAALV